jgi:type II secretory pathway component GspD/PulD (secretin)
MVRFKDVLATAAAIAILCIPSAGLAITYATIKDIGATQLSNGVQITVKADGILEWQPEGGESRYGFYQAASRIAVRFPGARSTVKNFIDVSMYPVSYVQTSVPQDAKEGIGISMVIGLFTNSSFGVSESPDRQSVIVTVNSERTLETIERGPAGPAEKQKSELSCTCEGGLVTVRALKADMLSVFGEIAKASGINIVVDDAVEQRVVSMSVEKSPADEVLKVIASAYGLALLRKDDVYMVSEGVPTDLATYRLSGTASFPLKYVQAQAASGLLPTFLYSYLHVNSEQNAVVVSAPSQMLDKIKTDLAKVDIAPPEIMIEALAIEVSSGVDLSLSLGLTGQGEHGQFTTDSETGNITYTTVGMLPRDFQANVKALVAQNKAKIYANPRMAVVNGHSADIFIGAQRFIRVEYSYDYGEKIQRIKAVDVGTKIAVTPWTGGNGEITTTISSDVSNIVELDRATGLPTLSSRRASTTVRVKDGETIVIGGLTTRQDYNTERRVPILGDLPIVGQAFRSRNRTSTQTELAILITPRVLSEWGHLPGEEESKIKDRMLGR